jgi:hypothetical protein
VCDIDHEFVEPAVVVGKAGAPLERKRVHPVHPEATLDDVDGVCFRSGEIAAFQLDIDEDIVSPVVVDERRDLLESIRHRHHRRQCLEFHVDQTGDVLSFRRRRTNRHRDRLPDVPHLSRCQDRPIRRLESRQFGS